MIDTVEPGTLPIWESLGRRRGDGNQSGIVLQKAGQQMLRWFFQMRLNARASQQNPGRREGISLQLSGKHHVGNKFVYSEGLGGGWWNRNGTRPRYCNATLNGQWDPRRRSYSSWDCTTTVTKGVGSESGRWSSEGLNEKGSEQAMAVCILISSQVSVLSFPRLLGCETKQSKN